MEHNFWLECIAKYTVVKKFQSCSPETVVKGYHCHYKYLGTQVLTGIFSVSTMYVLLVVWENQLKKC